LAIDVFKTMRDFGQTLTDPILDFAETGCWPTR
jgi:hypothetical protein